MVCIFSVPLANQISLCYAFNSKISWVKLFFYCISWDVWFLHLLDTAREIVLVCKIEGTSTLSYLWKWRKTEIKGSRKIYRCFLFFKFIILTDLIFYMYYWEYIFSLWNWCYFQFLKEMNVFFYLFGVWIILITKLFWGKKKCFMFSLDPLYFSLYLFCLIQFFFKLLNKSQDGRWE